MRSKVEHGGPIQVCQMTHSWQQAYHRRTGGIQSSYLLHLETLMKAARMKRKVQLNQNNELNDVKTVYIELKGACRFT